VATQGVAVHVGAETLKGDVSLDVIARVASGGASTDLSGTTASLEHVQGASFSDWWAKATVAKGVVGVAEGGWHGDLSLHLGASDAKPATSFVSKATGVPKWVVGLVSLPSLEGDGQVEFAPASFELRDIVVRGKTSWLRLELLKRQGTTRGLVLVRQGPLEAGFGIGMETPKFLLFGGDRWFESHKLALQSGELEGDSAEPDP
jgi:hypothetical protein